MSITADCSIPSKAIMVKGYSSFDYTCYTPMPAPGGKVHVPAFVAGARDRPGRS